MLWREVQMAWGKGDRVPSCREVQRLSSKCTDLRKNKAASPADPVAVGCALPTNAQR